MTRYADDSDASLGHFVKEKLGKKRIMLNEDQRRRLAVKVKVLGRKPLSAIASIVTPDTTLRWHRQLVAGQE